jgi:hypothetical protein
VPYHGGVVYRLFGGGGVVMAAVAAAVCCWRTFSIATAAGFGWYCSSNGNGWQSAAPLQRLPVNHVTASVKPHDSKLVQTPGLARHARSIEA